MLLNSEAACRGVFQAGAPAPICADCARRASPSRTHLVPLAAIDAAGEWQCRERRSAGHESTVTDTAPIRHPYA
jgi:hypothetical protein